MCYQLDIHFDGQLVIMIYRVISWLARHNTIILRVIVCSLHLYVYNVHSVTDRL